LHDIASFEKAKVPAVAILSSQFKPQAEYQAASLGLKDAARVFVQHPISDQSVEAIHKKADNIFSLVIERLVSTEDWTEEKDNGTYQNLMDADC